MMKIKAKTAVGDSRCRELSNDFISDSTRIPAEAASSGAIRDAEIAAGSVLNLPVAANDQRRESEPRFHPAR